MAENEGINIADKEKTAKTEFTDKSPKPQTQIQSQEDTVRNIEDKPQK